MKGYEMPSEHAKPGDTIEITFKNSFRLGKQFITTKRPDNIYRLDHAGDAWFLSEDGSPMYSSDGHYKIVSKSVDHGQVELSIDESLSRQLDNNLQNLFT